MTIPAFVYVMLRECFYRCSSDRVLRSFQKKARVGLCHERTGHIYTSYQFILAPAVDTDAQPRTYTVAIIVIILYIIFETLEDTTMQGGLS